MTDKSQVQYETHIETNMKSHNNEKNVENRSSRQAYTIGRDAMKKMSANNVLIYGMNAVGIAIAKMVIQNGARKVLLMDKHKTVQREDLRSFFFKESDLGKNKCMALLPRLQKLNPYVEVDFELGDEETVDKFIYDMGTGQSMQEADLVIFCGSNLFDLIPLNEKYRKKGIKFISANTFGLFGGIFVDFGNNFLVNDPNGVPVSSGSIVKFHETYIHKDRSGKKTRYRNVIEIDPSKTHTLQEKDLIRIIKNGKPTKKLFRVNHVINRYMFTLKSCNKRYLTDGDVSATEFVQHRKPMEGSHISLKSALSYCPIELTNMIDFQRPNHLLTIHKTVDMYRFSTRNDSGRINVDEQWSEEHVQKIKNMVHMINQTVPEILIRKLMYTLGGNLPMLDSTIAGFAAHEALKACSGKYTPINQFLYKDEVGLYPLGDDKKLKLTDAERKNFLPMHSSYPDSNKGGGKYVHGYQTRYDGMISVIGRKNVNKLRNSEVFMVGAGAVGCELIMNLSLMGVKKITLTDVDTIEQSNLNRQALFEEKDIGSFKSIAAAAKGTEMNSDVDYDARKDYVCPDTEDTYTQEFFKSVACVFPAVDNVNARRYIDSKCVDYHVPMIDCGTQGTDCSVQPVVPNITTNYSSTDDGTKETFPMCTVKNFPYRPEHLVQWGKSIFKRLFVEPYEALDKVLNDSKILKREDEVLQMFDTLQPLYSEYFGTHEGAVRYAYTMWHLLFVEQIKEIIRENPEDAVDSQGNPFWSGVKRFPRYSRFDMDNKLHTDFVLYCAKLTCDVWTVKSAPITVKYVKEVLDKISQTNPEKVYRMGHNMKYYMGCDRKVDKVEYLKHIVESDTVVNEIEFEKDDDTNGHVDFITTCVNMRGYNYRMAKMNKFDVKKIAGNIIPAINTTTTAVAGLGCVEFCKVVMGKNKVADYYSTFCGMARNSFQQFEPQEPKKTKIGKKEMTMWSIHKISMNDSLDDILVEFDGVEMETSFGTVITEVIDISSPNGSIYDKLDDEDDVDMDEPIKELLDKNDDDVSHDVHLNAVIQPVKYAHLENPSVEDEDKIRNFDSVSIKIVVKAD